MFQIFKLTCNNKWKFSTSFRVKKYFSPNCWEQHTAQWNTARFCVIPSFLFTF